MIERTTNLDAGAGKFVQVSLTCDEAIVLFELLQRFSETDMLSLEDEAEKRVLWNLCCLLEEKLTEPFSLNYSERLTQARNCLRDIDV